MSRVAARKSVASWWKVLFMVVLTGAAYAAVIALKWDRFVELSGVDEPTEYTEKDLLQCGPGTHQQGGRCMANESAPAAAASAAPAAPAAGPK